MYEKLKLAKLKQGSIHKFHEFLYSFSKIFLLHPQAKIWVIQPALSHKEVICVENQDANEIRNRFHLLDKILVQATGFRERQDII